MKVYVIVYFYFLRYFSANKIFLSKIYMTEFSIARLHCWIVLHLSLTDVPSLAQPFLPLVHTLRCGPTVGSSWSSSAPPSLERGRVALPPLDYTSAIIKVSEKMTIGTSRDVEAVEYFCFQF